MHKKRLATGLRLGPQGELTALPHFLQLDLRGSFATENDGQRRDNKGGARNN